MRYAQPMPSHRLPQALGDQSMLFGNSQDFAVEAHEESLPPHRGFGRLAVFVGGKVIGNVLEMHVGLGGPIETLRELRSALPRLYDEAFANKSASEVFELLDQALYVDDSRDDIQLSEDIERFSPFNFLTNAGEGFDDSKSFVYCESNKVVHIVWKILESGVVHSATCSATSFVFAVDGACKWLDDIYLQLKAGPNPSLQRTVRRR